MGLDTSHDAWHGSYSTFGAWRRDVMRAAEIGEDIWENEYEWCNYQGMWRESPTDALMVLIVHSDCDGFLFPHDMPGLVERLVELVPLLSEEWMKDKAEQFIAGLRDAYDKYEVIVFS